MGESLYCIGRSRSIILADQTAMIARFGVCAGESARNTRTDMMRTGTRRSNSGGGGSGGSTSGRTRMETVSRTSATADLRLKYPTM